MPRRVGIRKFFSSIVVIFPARCDFLASKLRIPFYPIPMVIRRYTPQKFIKTTVTKIFVDNIGNRFYIVTIMEKQDTTQAETLFEEFLRKKAMAYVEPLRAGTRRGERIGLSDQKYKACLLMLTNTKLSVISDWLGASYGLLRKWRTEELFKKMRNSLAEEFTDLVISYVKGSLQIQGATIKAWEKSTDELEYPNVDPIMLQKVGDVWNYGVHIREKIQSRFLKEISAISREDDLVAYARTVAAYTILLGPREEFEELTKSMQQPSMEIVGALAEAGLRILTEDSSSPDLHLRIKLFKIFQWIRAYNNFLKGVPKKEDTTP
jgi:hypothetical protein